MTDLIVAEKQETMTSSQLAELLGKEKKEINRNIKAMFGDEIDGGRIPPSLDSRGYVIDYHLPELESKMFVAKHDISYLKKITQFWIDNKKPALPQDLPTALRLYADQLEITASQEKLIAEQKPKALFADAVTSSASSILVGELAKLICQNGVKIGQNRLFVWLRDNGYLVRQRGENFNLPTQRSMDRGWFEIKVTTIDNRDGSKRRTSTTKVTGKGQVYFVNKFLGEGE